MKFNGDLMVFFMGLKHGDFMDEEWGIASGDDVLQFANWLSGPVEHDVVEVVSLL